MEFKIQDIGVSKESEVPMATRVTRISNFRCFNGVEEMDGHMGSEFEEMVDDIFGLIAPTAANGIVNVFLDVNVNIETVIGSELLEVRGGHMTQIANEKALFPDCERSAFIMVDNTLGMEGEFIDMNIVIEEFVIDEFKGMIRWRGPSHDTD